MDLSGFKRMDFLHALKALFQDLRVPVNYLTDEPTAAKTILKDTWKDNAAFNLIKDVYFLGIVDDAAFSGNKSANLSTIKEGKKDYDGIIIFGVTLKERENNLPPTRSQLAEITRAFNREYFYTPVVVVFKYSSYLAFANIERLKYKQEWREGEKTGKVSLLRDIDITNPHAGHLRILNDLKIPGTGKKKVDSFAKLYSYWRDVFSVSILNKKFYQELSNWYFWALKNVNFPGASDEGDHEVLFNKEFKVKEHNAKNMIRMLTRLLFVWFIKEKKLIPEELFGHKCIKKMLKKFVPEKKDNIALTSQGNMYYRAILQNLFFATLNQIKGKREFRKDKQQMNVTNLMRYKNYFKDSDKFMGLVETRVPFMNGGLFECLDIPDPELKGRRCGDVIIYQDGFSDRKDNKLMVPDYIFWSKEDFVDLSEDYGKKTKAYKNVCVKGLIPILESYKFTITENTPIEEDVALDPELLGKVFENLLASYNPETKTTARKQTGSFYTPREIVNYMVDESLIAYLKNSVKNWGIEAKELDKQLHDLLSYDAVNPFSENNNLQKQIIHALDNCKILDPACGSGAFPMGILQKMVHILQKVDPENKYWQELQLNKAVEETEGVFAITDKKEREEKLIEINDAFDEKINDPDYARKLFLVENCIYGVDIQEIAAQISKLRFFISLVVDQKVDEAKSNFGIRALPNLETKFVAANTLISIDKPEAQMSLFDKREITELEMELKNVRHRLFSAKSPAIKRRLRDKDKEIREKIGNLLVEHGWGNETAKQLAGWDPYDQNATSPFFDPEWMFGISDGFDVVIGNPPYVQIQKFSGQQCQKDWQNQKYKTFVKTGDIYSLFYEKGNMTLKDGGILTFITSNKWMRANYGKATRKYFAENTKPLQLIDFGGYKVFESATVDTNILMLAKSSSFGKANQKQDAFGTLACTIGKNFTSKTDIADYLLQNGVELENLSEESWIVSSKAEFAIKKRIEKIGTPLKDWDISIYRGVLTGFNKAFIIDGAKKDELIAKDPKSAEIIKPILRGRDIKRYKAEFADLWLINSHNGYRNIPPINIDDYPAIKNHLDNYWTNIKKRQDKGITPYNLRSCAYVEEFQKEKIIQPQTVKKQSFVLDNNCFFGDVSMQIWISKGRNLKYILAHSNAKIFNYYMRKSAYSFGETGIRWIPKFLYEVPIPKIPTVQQLPFEILVDCILFAKENNMETEANTLEWVVDGMVYDLYFPEEMKKGHCYITDRITEVVKPFKADDTDAFKKEYIEKLYQFCRNDRTVFRGLIHSRNIKVVKIIEGKKK
jgi:adenine-specific DNA-methyltransferase